MNAIDEILYIFYGWDRLGGHFTRDGGDTEEGWDIYETFNIPHLLQHHRTEDLK